MQPNSGDNLYNFGGTYFDFWRFRRHIYFPGAVE
jgi:hypothetical protein